MVLTDLIGILMQDNGHSGLNAAADVSHNPNGTCSVKGLSRDCQVSSSSHEGKAADKRVTKSRGKYHAKAVWTGWFYSKGTRFETVTRTKKLIY